MFTLLTFVLTSEEGSI